MALEGLTCIGDDTPRSWPPSSETEGRRRSLTIGLINNMPDAALSATEGQFRRLIEAGAGKREVRLKLFSVPELRRSEAARDAMQGRYASTETLPDAGVDALIVTGAEPLAADLRHEPYWDSLAALVDWAEANTVSAVWSCLAAHAAVLHLDRIQRRPLPSKCSGVFAMAKAARHPLCAGHQGEWLVPHSRLNALDEGDLDAKGYTILTRSPEIGVDAFIRQGASLFLFLQGHPEYDADSLALEYRRDVRRLLNGERGAHPAVPTGYFDPETQAALVALAREAAQRPTASVLSQCAKLIAAGPPVRRWAATTTGLYRNWLSLVAERRDAKAAVRA